MGYEEGPLVFCNLRFFKPKETDGMLERLAANSVTKMR